MKKRNFLLIILTITIVLGACTKEGNFTKVQLTVSAAASLTEVLEEIKTQFEEKNDNIEITFNFGASGDLQQQIANGAPVDLFISAALDKFELLEEKNMIDDDYKKELLLNELVLITKKGTNSNLNSFTDLSNNNINQIAIGTPESVPVGKYTKQTFEHLQIWDDLKDKLIFTKDVREVLHYVETDNVDAGLVYKTDAAISPHVEVVATAEKHYHDPVSYPAGIIKNTMHKEEAQLFYSFLQSEDAKSIYEKYGFKLMD